MGQKTNPIGFRLAVRRNWQSRWYAGKKDFGKLLHEDQIIRAKLMEKLKQASVPRIFIERASNRVRVKIYTARPGIVIGRKGQEIEKIKEELAKLTGKHEMRKKGKARHQAVPEGGRDITIREGAWIATGAIVIGPCEIGENAVVSAGSVVTGTVEAGAIYSGNPARFVRSIEFE